MPSSADQSIVTRRRHASPIEEFQIRLTAVAPPIHLADHEVAALLHETRTELVENDGTIRFTHAGLRREYYHPDSPTCQNRRGQKVVVAVSRTFADVLFVVTPDRQYLDTIPLKANLAWFNYDQLGHEIREQEQILKRAAKNLANLHGDEIQRRAYAGRGNVEKVEGWRDQRIVTTFSASPKSHIDAGPAGNGTPTESDTQGVDRSPLSPDAPNPTGAAASRHTVPPDHCSPVLRTDDSLLGESPRLSDGRSLQADRQSPFASAEEASRRSPTGAGGPIASQLVTATNRARRQHVTDLTEADARRARERARIRRLATVLEDY
jgi:hypothetical protein